MGRRRATMPAERLPGAPVEYQCARMDDIWHAMQEQASPPSIHQGGAWTICAVWAPFTRGYERRRPTCATCLRACEKDEGITSPTSPGALAKTLGATAVVPVKERADKGPPDTVETAVAHIDRALQEPHRTRAQSMLVSLCSYAMKLPTAERDLFSPTEAAAAAIRVGQAIDDGYDAARARVDEVAKLLGTARLCKPALVNFIDDIAAFGKGVAAVRAKHAAEGADFDAKLNALVAATRKSRR